MASLSLYSLAAIYFCTSIASFYALHCYLRSWLHRKVIQLPYWKCYIITTRFISGVFAVFISVICLRVMYITDDMLYQRDAVLENTMLIVNGYFTYDLFVMFNGFVLKCDATGVAKMNRKQAVLKFLGADFFVILHHLILQIAGAPLTVYIFQKNYGSFILAGFCFAEISTPFYSIRGILQVIDKTNGIMYRMSNLLFLVTFFIGRICTLPYLLYQYSCYKSIPLASVPSSIPLQCSMASLLFFSLQLYWFTLILKVVFGMLLKDHEQANKSNKQKNVEKVAVAQEKVQNGLCSKNGKVE